MPLSIRPARRSDADDIARLTTQLGYDVVTSDVGARLERILARPDQAFFIAAIDGHAAGWLHVAVAEYVEAERFVVVAGLVVDSRHRRQGVGTALVQHAEQWAATQGCSIVRLWSTSTRAGAHRFYERLGFTNVKTQFSFVKPLDGAAADVKKFVPRVDE
jgi:GNAT superfamily N-acetyltransferase